MITIQDILTLVTSKTGLGDVHPTSDIRMDLGCYGDDFHELMDEYAVRYKVDMDSHRWYFHTEEEGSGGIGAIFFKAPNERVERISVTPQMLLGFAINKKWEIKYPEHTVSNRRYDLLLNAIIIAIVIAVAIYGLISCCVVRVTLHTFQN